MYRILFLCTNIQGEKKTTDDFKLKTLHFVEPTQYHNYSKALYRIVSIPTDKNDHKIS